MSKRNKFNTFDTIRINGVKEGRKIANIMCTKTNYISKKEICSKFDYYLFSLRDSFYSELRKYEERKDINENDTIENAGSFGIDSIMDWKSFVIDDSQINIDEPT